MNRQGGFHTPNPNSGVEWVYTMDDLNKNGQIEYEEQMHLSNSLPAIHDGLLLTTDLSGLVHCLDVTTGELLWTHDQLATCWSGPLLAMARPGSSTRMGICRSSHCREINS